MTDGRLEITGAARGYPRLAHPSAHACTPQVMNAELAGVRGLYPRVA